MRYFFYLAILILCSCEPKEKSTPKVTKKSLVVTHYEVIQMDKTSTIDVNGITAPFETIALAFRVSGVVDKVNISLGDEIKKDDILATLEDQDFKLQIEKSQQLLKLAQSRLTKVKAKGRTESIQIAKARIRSAKNAYENKLKTYQAQADLYKSSIVSEIDIDKLKTDADVALEELNIAQEELVLLEKGARIEDIQVAQEEVALSEIETKIQAQNLKYTKLHAPIDAIVTEIDIEKGEFFNSSLNPISVAMTIDNLYRIKLKVSVPETEIHQVKIDQDVKVTILSLNRNWLGKISYVPPKADPISKTFSVEVLIPNKQLEIKGGMFANASIQTGQTRKTTFIPPELLHKDGRGIYVYKLVLVEDRYKVIRQSVQTGVFVQKFIEIKQGLNEKDWIVKDGSHNIQDQDIVELKVSK